MMKHTETQQELVTNAAKTTTGSTGDETRPKNLASEDTVGPFGVVLCI